MKNGFPALIKGIQEADQWAAREKWRPLESLLEHYGQVPLKVGEVPPIHGMGRAYQIRLPLVLFKEYADTATGDSPFYGFEYDFNDERAALLSDYKIPEYFQSDFFDVDPIARNFYTNNRHLIVGGERTGTNLHFDPKGTSAWNSLLIGRKKWAIFPPGTDMEYIQKIKTRTCSSGTAPGGPASYWWLDIAPTLPADVGMVEFIQNPGDTVFVPPGWWHAVINIEFSMAITQNVLIPESLPFVWAQLRKDWPKFVQYIESNYPEKLQELGVQDITPSEKRILSLEDEEFLVEFHSTQNQ
uniref:JmjC domain-containing protein n=1 Tax=Arcella intermedia TaxID=1963864 RepID=A0A6B2LAT9_9EUKA